MVLPFFFCAPRGTRFSRSQRENEQRQEEKERSAEGEDRIRYATALLVYFTRVTRWPAVNQIPPAAAWYSTIICVRFFRAERGKTEHQQKESTALPKAKKADRVSRVL
jgi:hypothetical protein